MRVQQSKCSWKRLLGTGGLLGSAGRWEEMLLIWSSFQSIRSTVSKPCSETLEVSCPSNFLLSWAPRVWAMPCTLSGHCCAEDLPAYLPFMMPKALAWVSGLTASKTAGNVPLRPPHGQGRLLQRASTCCQVNKARGCPFIVPSSDGCCPPLLCWDSIPTKHP